MSEQTPDANNGMSDGQDPSMEDILASIRKIIADDDVQGEALSEAVDTSLDVVSEVDVADGDLSELAHVETLDLDIIEEETPALDADIDALIGDMDANSADALTIPEIGSLAVSEDVLDDVLDLEIPMDDAASSEIVSESIDLLEDESLALEDDLMELVIEGDDEVTTQQNETESSGGLMGGALAALGLGGMAATAAKSTVTEEVDAGEEDLSLMLDNMLEDSSSYNDAATAEDVIAENAAAEEIVTQEPAIEEQIIDPAEDLLSEIDFINEAPADAAQQGSDPDMDLVKSLMADLTEEPLHDDAELEAEDEVMMDEALLADIDDDADEGSDNVMDEILSMTLDDETKLSEEIAIPELNAPYVEDVSAESLSLKDIAAAAKADADASDAGLPADIIAGLGAAAIGGVAAASIQDEAPEVEVAPETDDVNDVLSQLDDLLADETDIPEDTMPEEPVHLSPEPFIEESPEMARAKKTDAIIDEVTETATAGAFASLTNVVENKAVTAERGDRIGDLVMEALQPMLKEWLDANLKGIVERAVTKEVKRISSGK